jgi:putative peptidoglycan lipid II flippase
MAYALGVTLIADSYDIANNLPNMVFELLAGGVLSSVFIPLFMDRMRHDDNADAMTFANSVLNIILLVLGAVALIGTLWPEPFVRTQTLTIAPERAALAVHLFRFFAVQIVFYGAGLVFTGVLNAHRRFLAPAIAPIFNNLVVTVTLLAFYVPLRDSNPDLAIAGLGVGTTLGVLAMVLVQLPSLLKIGYRYKPRIDWHHPALRTAAAKMGPTLVYVITNLVSVSFRTNVAVATGEGGQAALRYAWQFYQLPYGIFAVALATAIFPELAESASRQDWRTFKAMFSKGLRATAVLIIPLSAMLMTLATPIIMLYRAGRFTGDDVPMVAGVLVWWAAGLTFFAGYMFVLKTFYSLKDTATPMYTNIVASALHVALYALLATGAGLWKGLGIIGIPIADGIFFLLHLGALIVLLRRKVGVLDLSRTFAMIGKVAIAAVVGGLAALGVVALTSGLTAASGGFLVQLGLAGATGLALTFGLAAALGVREVRTGAERVRDMVRTRLRPNRGP